MIEAHPQDYASGEGWQENVVQTMEGIVPYAARGLLDKLLVPNPKFAKGAKQEKADEQKNNRRLGW